MKAIERHIDVQREGDVLCVRLKDRQLDDDTIRAMADEVESLIQREGCTKLVLRLGEINCLYSVLIAKLIKLRRTMSQRGGSLKICDVSPEVMDVFVSCQLQSYFDFARDPAEAITSFKKVPKTSVPPT
jgi:anti-sigma B factor antagonist